MFVIFGLFCMSESKNSQGIRYSRMIYCNIDIAIVIDVKQLTIENENICIKQAILTIRACCF